jgi:hypothetical protein
MQPALTSHILTGAVFALVHLTASVTGKLRQLGSRQSAILG